MPVPRTFERRPDFSVSLLPRRLLALALLAGSAVLGSGAGPALAADDEEAVLALRRMQRSVVTLRSVEGRSTGVVLRADGLILTGSFVVASPVPVHVVVEGSGAKAKPTVFRKVELIGYHPHYDLALVRIDAKEHKVPLTPATVSRVKGNPGQSVYAIGVTGEPGSEPGLAAAGGILSAVDREVDGANYYQMDAPLGAGHAGGPVVDRSGNVLGIVAFAFAELEAVSFAIPLHDVDLAGFVSASNRKADSGRAQALIAAAERFSRNSLLSLRLEGRRGASWFSSTAYAVLAYRMALAAAPGEPVLYYNIGMFLRSLDEDAAAVPYLVRAIQMTPWAPDNGSSYRELGLALAKQGGLEAAHAAWREGVTKQPYASLIWENLAIYHLRRRELPDAMYAASVALYVPEHATRVTLLNEIRARVRSVLPGPTLAEIDARTNADALRADLGRMVALSNRARAERQLYVTRAFRDLIRSLGGPSVAGVEQRIPQDPLPGLER